MPWFGGGRVEKEQAIDTSPAVYPTYGALSNMRRSIFTITSHHERHVRPSHAISRFIIKSAFIRHLITKLLLKCIFTRHKQGEWRTQSRRKEKEESSSYLNRFLCLDNVGHHTVRRMTLPYPSPTNIYCCDEREQQGERNGRNLA